VQRSAIKHGKTTCNGCTSSACVRPSAAGPFISYVNLQEIEQHLAGNGSPHDAAANATDWHAVGGYSLHEQRELWDQNAAGRVRRL
jgi:hypothetical protein